MTTILISGTRRQIDASPDMPLLWVPRDKLGLTATKFGRRWNDLGQESGRDWLDLRVHVGGSPDDRYNEEGAPSLASAPLSNS